MTETLFWKVFHNIYLFNLIINQIQTTEWVIYDTVLGHHKDNRKRFKDITSLNWLIQHKQYSLLKCKLEAGEHIDFEINGIKSLFCLKSPIDNYFNEELKKQNDIMYHCEKVGYYRDIKEKQYTFKTIEEKRNEIEIENSKIIEIQQMVFSEKYKDQLIDFNLIGMLVEPNERIGYQVNSNLLFVFQSEPFLKVIDYSNILVNLFKNSPPELVQNVIGQSRANQIKFKDIDIEQLIKLSFTNHFLNRPLISDCILENSIYLSSGNLTNDYQEIKQFNRLLSTKSKIIYKEYLLKYDETINGGDNKVVYEYALESYNEKALDYLLSTDDFDISIYEIFGKLFTNPNKKISNEFIKLYSIGYQNIQCGECTENIIQHIMSSSTNDQELQTFLKLISSNTFENKLPKYWNPLLNLEKEFEIIIKDKETIEWIVSNIEFFNSILKNKHKKRIRFHSSDLFGLSIGKFKSIKSLCKIVDFNNINDKEAFISGPINQYSLAINSCDVDLLKKLDGIFINEKFKKFDNVGEKSIHWFLNLSHLNGERDFIEPLNFKNQTTESISKLIEYLNSTNYKCFSPELFKQFIKCLSKSASFENSGIEITNLKINFNQFKNQSIELYIESITDKISPNLTKLLSNNGFNPFISTINDFNHYFKLWDKKSIDKIDESSALKVNAWEPVNHSCLYYKKPFFNTLAYTTSGESSEDITESIKLLLNEYTSFNSIIIHNESSFQVLELFEKMVNYLFKRLIRVNNVSKLIIMSIYQLISNTISNKKESSFKIQHSIYHIYYYLGIRSLKFIQLIFTITPRLNEYDSEVYEINDYSKNGKRFDSLKKLISTEYTFDFIFNSPFQIVMDKLTSDINDNGGDNEMNDYIHFF